MLVVGGEVAYSLDGDSGKDSYYGEYYKGREVGDDDDA